MQAYQPQPRSARAARFVVELVVSVLFMLPLFDVSVEDVPLVVPAAVPLVVPLVLVLLSIVDEPVLPELVVPAVPLVALELLVSVPGPGLEVVLEPLFVPSVDVPVDEPVLAPVLEPVDAPDVPPADDCAYEKPAVASKAAAAAAMARPFEIWFMV